jgi:monoamine oxidase
MIGVRAGLALHAAATGGMSLLIDALWESHESYRAHPRGGACFTASAATVGRGPVGLDARCSATHTPGMPHTPVAIIGGGLAGLHAAHQLHRAGMHFMLFEARDRLGGRILSVDERGTPSADGFDLGPSWFWPRMQPAIAELITELGLAAFPQASDGDVLVERMSREGPRRFRGDAQEPLSFRLAGGTAALLEALQRDLPVASVRRSAAVTAMTLTADGVVLTLASSDGDAGDAWIADHVIAALPPRLLASTVTFTPALDAATRQRWQATPTWMAPHAKFVAIYDHAFWRDAGLSGTAQSMVGPMPEMHDATTASGKAALFGFLGIGADQRAALGTDEMTRACVAQLVRLFGAEAAHPRATLVMDWAAERFTATVEDRVAGGHPVVDRAPWVSGPWRDRLTLGGSETSVSEPGYLAGAVTASRQAVASWLGA